MLQPIRFCPSVQQPVVAPIYQELSPSDLQRIVYHYFIHENLLSPSEYLSEITIEMETRLPTPRELYYCQLFHKWLLQYYEQLEYFVIISQEEQQNTEKNFIERNPEEIIDCFEEETGVSLQPKELWSFVVLQIVKANW